jgi:hypothetical protein
MSHIKEIAKDLLVACTHLVNGGGCTYRYKVFELLSQAYREMGKPMPSNFKQVDQLPRDFLLAKIIRGASNFFVIIHAYPDTWEDNYLDMDLDTILNFLTVLTIQEEPNGPTETISYPTNYSGDKTNT